MNGMNFRDSAAYRCDDSEEPRGQVLSFKYSYSRRDQEIGIVAVTRTCPVLKIPVFALLIPRAFRSSFKFWALPRRNPVPLSMASPRGVIWLALAALAALTLLGCGKQENPNDWPVSHWLDDPDPCVRETAAAIVASGKPWPNEVRDEKGKLIRFDFWIGDQLYELPGDTPLIRSGFAPHAHPLRYSSVSGHAETFLGVPRDQWLKFKQPGVGGTLYGNVYCSNNLPPNQWIEARALHAPNRREAIEMALERSRKAGPQGVLRVEVNERNDIHMTEVRSYTNPPELAGASYFPMNRDVAQTINGQRMVKNIGCRPYDPEAKLHVGYLCHSWIYLGPGLWLEFEVYQQMLPIVPDLHDKFLETFEQSRRK